MKTKKTLSVLLFITLSLTFLTIVSTADFQISSIPQHKGMVCLYCHETKGFSIGDHEDEAGCDNCHSIKDSISALEQAHSNICKSCHVIPSNDEQYHNLHKGIDCAKCHTGTGVLPVKPTTGITNCAVCHGVIFSGGNSNIHITHEAILTDICTKCHGSRPSSDPSGIELSTSDTGKTSLVIGLNKEVTKINNDVYAKVIDYKRYTLYEIFKVIFAIFQ